MTDEPAKTHDGVGNTSRHLVDDEVIDLTYVLAVRSIDLGPMDVFARNALTARAIGVSPVKHAPISIQFDFVADVPEIAEQALCNAVTGIERTAKIASDESVGCLQSFAVIYH
jgi:hypothetical protein